jgi:hypothetical protein
LYFVGSCISFRRAFFSAKQTQKTAEMSTTQQQKILAQLKDDAAPQVDPVPAVDQPQTAHPSKKRKRGDSQAEHQQQPCRKRAAAVKKPAADDEPASDGDDGGDKKKVSSAVRRQPGYAMIKAEDDRLRRALDGLIRKREQRETVGGGRATTSTCGVLTNNLIEFYEDTLSTFSRKFGRYIA